MTATTISMAGGERRVQDGPYADTKEQLGGYFVIEVADLDTALDWAAKCPAVQYGMVADRFQEPPDRPSQKRFPTSG